MTSTLGHRRSPPRRSATSRTRHAYFHTLGTDRCCGRHGGDRAAAQGRGRRLRHTLWRGVVGEVGAEGVEFGEEHLLLQDVLAESSRNGVVVCLCSKNVEEDVWRVFDTRPDMHLEARAHRRGDGELASQVGEHPRARQHAEPRAGQLRVSRRQPRGVRGSPRWMSRGAHARVAARRRGGQATPRAHLGTRHPGQHGRGPHPDPDVPRRTRSSEPASGCWQLP